MNGKTVCKTLASLTKNTARLATWLFERTNCQIADFPNFQRKLLINGLPHKSPLEPLSELLVSLFSLASSYEPFLSGQNRLL